MDQPTGAIVSDTPEVSKERLEWIMVGLRPDQIRRLEALKYSIRLNRSQMIREAVDRWLSDRTPTAFGR